MACEIGEKEIPLGHAPDFVIPKIIERDEERGDEIERLSQIGQGNKRLDSPNDARHIEQFSEFIKHRMLINIETDRVVAEPATEINEIASTRSKIEDAKARRRIHAQFAGALDVHANPPFEIEIFFWTSAGILYCVAATDFAKAVALDARDDFINLDPRGRNKTDKKLANVSRGAGETFAAGEFF